LWIDLDFIFIKVNSLLHISEFSKKLVPIFKPSTRSQQVTINGMACRQLGDHGEAIRLLLRAVQTTWHELWL
jgi:hypothetical protein